MPDASSHGTRFAAAAARRSPIVLWVIAVLFLGGVIITTWIDQPSDYATVTVAGAAIYLAWLMIELPITVRSSSGAEAPADAGTVQLYGIARVATLIACFSVSPRWSEVSAWAALGVAVLVGGIVLRVWAIRALSHHYSHKVRLVTGHQIVTHGPYRVLRHPAYAGMLIAHAALVGLQFNLLAGLAFVVLLLPIIVVRIVIEEKTLHTMPSYEQYSARVDRLLPGVW